MKNLYQQIYAYKKDDIKHCLQLLGLLDMFAPIYEHYPRDIHEPATLYIINAYCKDSPHIYIAGATWSRIKENCARMAPLPAEYWENFVYLGEDEDAKTVQADLFKEEDDDVTMEEKKQKPSEEEITAVKEKVIDDRISAVIDVINSFLDFQGGRDHRHLMNMYDLYEEMLAASTTRLKKGGGNTTIDYEAKRRCMKEATSLLEEIKSFELRMKEEDVGLQSAREEMKKKGNIKKTFRPEAMQ